MPCHRILYVEDEEVWEQCLREHIESINKLRLNEKFKTRIDLVRVDSSEAFLSRLAADGPFDLAFIDLNLKDDAPGEGKGKVLLERLKDVPDAPPRVVLTARPWVFGAEEALSTGISEYYLKDTLIADGALRPSESHRANIIDFLETFFDLPSRYDFSSDEGRRRFGLKAPEAVELHDTIVGDELCMWKVKAQIADAARSDLPVLITGETGTGKALAADFIHRLSDRGQKGSALLSVNCGAFTADLLERELFGRARGAEDARTDKRGLLEEAHDSTLFVREIEQIDRRLQTSLLQAFRTGRARRLDGAWEYRVSARLIAASDRDVAHSGSFESSFVNKLDGIRIHMPALRVHRGDIDVQRSAGAPVRLVSHLAHRIGAREGIAVRFTTAAIMALARHSWPGNVWELTRVIEGAIHEVRRRGGMALEITVDAAHVRWQLQQSMRLPLRAETYMNDVFAAYIVDGEQYGDVERRFLAEYVHHVHEKVTGGERSNSAYERTAKFLGCGISLVKTRLADFDRKGAVADVQQG